MRHILPVGVSLVLALGGCATRDRPVVETYDFGLAAKPGAAPVYAARLPREIAIAEVAAPAWMDTPAVIYRLAFRNAARPDAYAASRWVMPPAQLVTERFRSTFAARGVTLVNQPSATAALLRVELEEFSHVFDSESASRVVLRARVTSSREGALTRQTVIAIERPVTTGNARGAATALAQATDEMIEQVLGWVD